LSSALARAEHHVVRLRSHILHIWPQALFDYAMSSEKVRIVRPHTLPDGKTSIRMLEKLGFTCIGEVMDPEDGLVVRWEIQKEAT
jgi:hypothetical protein